MNIVVVGLGIIGGSYCKAIKKYTEHKVIGITRSKKTLQDAIKCGAIDEIGNEQSLKSADLIILGLYPQYAIDFIEQNVSNIKKGCIVTDTSGIKLSICPKLMELAKANDFIFIGSHPMAGKEKNGFEVSEADLFKGASFIVVPSGANRESVNLLCRFALSIGFGEIRIATPQEHDEMIAFTSQLPHVLACSYVLSPKCKNHKGFSAGSYRDVSRVANINATLWTELFLENSKPLAEEIGVLIENLTQMKNAIEKEDSDKIYDMLEKGRKIKEELSE